MPGVNRQGVRYRVPWGQCKLSVAILAPETTSTGPAYIPGIPPQGNQLPTQQEPHTLLGTAPHARLLLTPHLNAVHQDQVPAPLSTSGSLNALENSPRSKLLATVTA